MLRPLFMGCNVSLFFSLLTNEEILRLRPYHAGESFTIEKRSVVLIVPNRIIAIQSTCFYRGLFQESYCIIDCLHCLHYCLSRSLGVRIAWKPNEAPVECLILVFILLHLGQITARLLIFTRIMLLDLNIMVCRR